MNAIVSSGEVKQVLQDFQSKDLISDMAVLNLILSLEELSDLIASDSTPDNGLESGEHGLRHPPSEDFCAADEPAQPRALDQSGKEPGEPGQENFDQDAWLKKARIKF
ncbi:MAG: hypothetical protein ACE5GQ_00945 [Nitrospinales bacterium]